MKQKLDRFLRAHPPIRFAADMADVYFSKRVSRAAAELAYFLILTFFPIMICISAFVNELRLDLPSLVDHADPFLPEGVLVLFRDYLTYIDTNQSAAMLLSGAFLTILSASAAVRGLMNIMHEIYGRATFRGLGQLVASILSIQARRAADPQLRRAFRENTGRAFLHVRIANHKFSTCYFHFLVIYFFIIL